MVCVEFEEHRRPNESRLEPFRKQISKMRAKSWPYQRIVEWLQTHADLTISAEAVRKYCLTREITKAGEKRRTIPKPTSTVREPESDIKFSYQDSGPIITRKDRS